LQFIPKQYIYLGMASKKLCATCGVSDPAMTAHCVLPARLCEYKRRMARPDKFLAGNNKPPKMQESSLPTGNFAQQQEQPK